MMRLFCAIALLLGLLPGNDPAAAATPADSLATLHPTTGPQWGVAVHHAFESLQNGGPDWFVRGVMVQHRLARGSLSLEAGQVARRGTADARIALDGYLDVGTKAYLNVRLQRVEAPTVLPATDVLVEGYQGIGRGWEVSGGYRQMRFPEEQVHLLMAAAGRYVGNWYLRGRSVVIPRGGTAGAAVTLSARRYFGAVPGSFYEISGGRGREVERLGASGSVSIRRSWFGAGRVQWFWWPALGLSLSASYTADETLTRWGGGVGLVTRW